jgi:hypothetical protein
MTSACEASVAVAPRLPARRGDWAHNAGSPAGRCDGACWRLLAPARLRPTEREPVDLSMLVVDAVSDAHVAGPDHAWRLEVPDEPVTCRGRAASSGPRESAR